MEQATMNPGASAELDASNAISIEAALDKWLEQEGDPHPLVSEFAASIIVHEAISIAGKELIEAIVSLQQGDLIVVVGPSCVGKTTLAKYVADKIATAIARGGRQTNPRVMYFEIAAPDNGSFKFPRHLYIPILKGLKEPGVRSKIVIDQKRVDGSEISRFAKKQPQLAIENYRSVTITALEDANVVALFLDDAHHIRRGTTGAGVFDKYSTLKSFAGESPAKLICLGTGELKEIARQTGQLATRIVPIFFLPYQDDEPSRGHFYNALGTMQQVCPLLWDFILKDKLEILFAGALYEVGLAHKWLQRALQYCLMTERKKIGWDVMQRWAPSDLVRATIRREMGEIREYLKVAQAESDVVGGIAGESQSAERPAKAQSKRKPGVRLPARDPVPRIEL
jgi:hypothetical protein